MIEALMMARANERLVALKHEEAPRSWSKQAKLAFLHLPPEIQAYYVGHEKQRDREVRRAQNSRADALKNLALAEARIAELEKLIVRETGNDPTATDPFKCGTGKNDVDIEIKDAAA